MPSCMTCIEKDCEGNTICCRCSCHKLPIPNPNQLHKYFTVDELKKALKNSYLDEENRKEKEIKKIENEINELHTTINDLNNKLAKLKKKKKKGLKNV